jgi:hypothetical protein
MTALDSAAPSEAGSRPVGDATLDALATMSGGNDAVAQLAMLYAKAFEENPAAAFGMLAVTLTMVQQQTADIHKHVSMVQEKVQPFIDNPELLRESLMNSLPPQLQMLFGG